MRSICFLSARMGQQRPCLYNCGEYCKMAATHHQRGGNSILAGADFILPLSDAGSGGVVTTQERGGGSPTFTRATVKWTKLATGLWASVASGTAASRYLGENTEVGEYGGYFQEAAGTQLVTPTASIRDMTQAEWAATNITAALTGTGIGGVANSCSRLTATAADGTIFQTLTAAASSRTYSVFLKRVTGSGAISITQDGGSTYTAVTSSVNSSTFTRVSITASQLNAVFGIKMSTDTDVILADFNQFEAGAFATSPMASAGAARNADALTYVFAGNADAAAGTVYAEMSSVWTTPGGTYTAIAMGANAAIFVPSAGGAGLVRITDGTTTVTKSGLASSATGIRKRASSWGGLGLVITGDGAAVATGSFDGAMSNTNIAIGSGWNGTLKNVRLWQRQLDNEQLIKITA